MPELAEVETIRRRLASKLKGKTVTDLVLDKSDRYLFAFARPADVRRALLGARVLGAGRKGKYFWLELNRKPWPLFHLGMSGNVSLMPAGKRHGKVWGGAKLWSEGDKEPDNRLWFSRLSLEFDDESEMAFIDPRRFGRIWLTDDPWTHPRIRKLGFDPLIDFPSAKILMERLEKRRKPIKSLLLDQGLFAGIGNWLADEILYQARIAPHRLASELKLPDVSKIHRETLHVVKTAVAARADYEKFPVDWLFHERWGKVKDSRTKRGAIVHEQIGGRTSAWVPKWQK